MGRQAFGVRDDIYIRIWMIWICLLFFQGLRCLDIQSVAKTLKWLLLSPCHMPLLHITTTEYLGQWCLNLCNSIYF